MTARFASLPALIVIDGGKGQLSSGMGVLAEFVERGVCVVSLAKRLEEVFVPGRKRPIVLPADSVALQLLQRLRDEAHRFAIEHHRIRRDRSMKASILDELPGIGPARKRTLLRHFGSPERFLPPPARSSSRSPGCPGRSPGASTSNSTGLAPPSPPDARAGREESAAHAAPFAGLPKRLSALLESLVCRSEAGPGPLWPGIGREN